MTAPPFKPLACLLTLALSGAALALPLTLPDASAAHAFMPPRSRFSAGMEAAPVPDDSQASRQSAIARLRQGPARRPVCPGVASEVPTHLGTACGTREFEAAPLLEAPKLQWLPTTGWYSQTPFVVSGHRVFVNSCNRVNDDNVGLHAFDARTGKQLWNNRDLCTGAISTEPDRLFVLANDVLMLAQWRAPLGYRQYQVDMKTGKLLSEQKKLMYLWNVQKFGERFVSQNVATKGDAGGFIAAQELDRGPPVWKVEGFAGECPSTGRPERCVPYRISRFAYADGILYASAASQGPVRPWRQLHAIDMQSGKILWKHTGQPTVYRMGKNEDTRSNDTSPMVVDGKVIVRVEGLLGWRNQDADGPASVSYRALDAHTGATIWTTEAIPMWFEDEWLPRGRFALMTQEVGAHMVAGNMLLAMVGGDSAHREVWAYHLGDGRAAWRRPLPEQPRVNHGNDGLGASAGGVAYLTVNSQLLALDARTGTLLWTYALPTDPDSPDDYRVHPGRKPNSADWRMGETDWSIDWVIGPEGAVYGTRPRGPFKLQ